MSNNERLTGSGLPLPGEDKLSQRRKRQWTAAAIIGFISKHWNEGGFTTYGNPLLGKMRMPSLEALTVPVKLFRFKRSRLEAHKRNVRHLKLRAA